MSKRRRRRNDYQKNSRPGKRPNEQLADAQYLIERAADYFNQRRYKQGYQQLRYLRENQGDDNPYFCKSLSALSEKIFDPALKLELLAEAVEVRPSDPVSLSSYATALAQAGRYDLAFERFEQSLAVDPENTVSLSSYATALAQAGRYDLAFERFEQSLAVDPENHITLVLYANALERKDHYEKALSLLEQIEMAQHEPDYAAFLYSIMGRLCYLTKEEDKGNDYFDLAIENSSDEIRMEMYNAKGLLVNAPHNETAVQILQGVIQRLPGHAEAQKLLMFTLSGEGLFQAVQDKDKVSLKSTQDLASTIYHKMINEINVLKSILYRMVKNDPVAQEVLDDVVTDVEDILAEVRHKRTQERAEVQAIPSGQYTKLLEVISDTAHDISDFVNNRIFSIKSQLYGLQYTLAEGNAFQSKLADILEQVEFAESALNDLKAIEHGVEIIYSDFSIQKFFERWSQISHLQHAALDIKFDNGESSFSGDLAKIRGFVNELIENAIRHNPEQSDLKIEIRSQDVEKTPIAKGRTLDHKRRYWHISVADNGQGVPITDRDKIFLPLHTTSEEGSGLGLFILRRMLQKMQGYIEVSGSKGVNFQLYLPYHSSYEEVEPIITIKL